MSIEITTGELEVINEYDVMHVVVYDASYSNVKLKILDGPLKDHIITLDVAYED